MTATIREQIEEILERHQTEANGNEEYGFLEQDLVDLITSAVREARLKELEEIVSVGTIDSSVPGGMGVVTKAHVDRKIAAIREELGGGE